MSNNSDLKIKALKYRDENDNWNALYVDYLKNCMLKGNNLSDVANKEEARKNLELVGEVNTHTHNSMYVNKEQLNSAIANSKTETIKAINESNNKSIADVYDYVDKNIDSKASTLQKDIDSIKNDLNNYKKNFYFLNRASNNIQPSAAQVGAIAFICGETNPHIEYNTGSEWISMGAVWR